MLAMLDTATGLGFEFLKAEMIEAFQLSWNG
jgi:hypothetical protein